jgi:hypothetical protein
MILRLGSLIILLTTLFAWPATTTFAQDAVPREILKRTQLIKVGNATGTTFSLEHQGKLYLVTARHVVAGLSVDKPTIELWRSNKWESVQQRRILLPPSPDVDIAVLDSEEQAAQPYSIIPAEDDVGPTLGQQVWFLGYPFRGCKSSWPSSRSDNTLHQTRHYLSNQQQ